MVRRPLQEVNVFGVQDRRNNREAKRPWIVRWAIDGHQKSKAFRAKAEAEHYRSLLLLAQRKGEPFDPMHGEPVSWHPLVGEVKVVEWVRRWLAEQWPEWQPRTRASVIEAMARFVPLAVAPSAPAAPVGIRAHLVATLRPDAASKGVESCERWLARWSMPLDRLSRDLLAGVDQKLGLRDDRDPLSASTASRYRKTARSCIRRAVELELLSVDPWPPPPRGRARRKAARVSRRVDIRSLPDPATMQRAITAIPSHQPASRTYQVMTAVAYYGGLRPSEVVMLRPGALHLPPDGWGRIDVSQADISFDEPGEPKTGPRSVPIPPPLVSTLRSWIDEHGFAPGDLLFRTRSGKRPTASNWGRAWQRALRQIGQPSLRVYDCRHAAATTWLTAGVPLGEVARRLGHSVETLVSTYVGALAGDEQLANDRIEALFAASEPGAA